MPAKRIAVSKDECYHVMMVPDNGQEVSGYVRYEPDWKDFASEYGYVDRFFLTSDDRIVWYRQYLHRFYARSSIELKFGTEYYDHDGNFGTPESGNLKLTKGWFWEVMDDYKPPP